MSDKPAKLSAPRLALLRRMQDEFGGRIPERMMTVPGKRLCTQMERDGLTQRGFGGPGIVSEWGYSMTPNGRAALLAAMSGAPKEAKQ